jgi:hypothetical protein
MADASTLVSVTPADANFRYRITAQATSSTTAAISMQKTDLNTQAVTNSTHEITDVAIINDVFKGKTGGETFTITNGPNDEETIQTGGFFWGIGAQTFGPFVLSPTDYTAFEAWKLANFAHN